MPAIPYPTQNIKMPLVEVRLFDEGNHDRIVTDRGYVFHDILRKSYKTGYWEYDADSGVVGVKKLEWLRNIGLVNRPYVVLQNTDIDNYVTSGGTWREQKPFTGMRISRLVQSDTSIGVSFQATSTFPLPENPHVAFELVLPETPPDWNYNSLPPYVRLELGNGTWAIHLDKQETRLEAYVNGQWTKVEELPSPSGGEGYVDTDSILIWLRCYRGKILISTNYGKSYDTIEFPGNVPLTIQSAPLVIKGQGGSIVFGMHQIKYKTGKYRCKEQNTFTSRPLLTAAAVTARYDLHGGVAPTLTDISNPVGALAQYEVTLTPTVVQSFPWDFYTGPAVYSVTLRYPVVSAATTNTYTTPFTKLTRVSIKKPLDPSTGTCDITFQTAPNESLSQNLRNRKIQVLLGFRFVDDSEVWATAFTGYISDRSAEWTDEWGRISRTITAQNALYPFRRDEWDPLGIVPLGGLVANDAADYVLDSLGRVAADRTWHALGDVFLLPSGLPEEPYGMTKRKQKKYDTLKEIFQVVSNGIIRGLQVVALDDGTLLSIPKNPEWTTGVTHEYYVHSGADIVEDIWEIESETDYGESATAAVVTGELEDGTTAFSFLVDTPAETAVLSGRFSPWREIEQDDLGEGCTPGIIATRTQVLASDVIPIKESVQLGIFARLDMSRGDAIEIYNAEAMDIADGTVYKIVTLDTEWTIDGRGVMDLKNRAGLWRIPV